MKLRDKLWRGLRDRTYQYVWGKSGKETGSCNSTEKIMFEGRVLRIETNGEERGETY